MQFDIETREYNYMPDMLEGRRDPGCFFSYNHEYIYVFGGKNNSMERLSIKGFNNSAPTEEQR